MYNQSVVYFFISFTAMSESLHESELQPLKPEDRVRILEAKKGSHGIPLSEPGVTCDVRGWLANGFKLSVYRNGGNTVEEFQFEKDGTPLIISTRPSLNSEQLNRADAVLREIQSLNTHKEKSPSNSVVSGIFGKVRSFISRVFGKPE